MELGWAKRVERRRAVSSRGEAYPNSGSGTKGGQSGWREAWAKSSLRRGRQVEAQVKVEVDRVSLCTSLSITYLLNCVQTDAARHMQAPPPIYLCCSSLSITGNQGTQGCLD